MNDPSAARLVIEMVQARVNRMLNINATRGYHVVMNEVVNMDIMLRELRAADEMSRPEDNQS